MIILFLLGCKKIIVKHFDARAVGSKEAGETLASPLF